MINNNRTTIRFRRSAIATFLALTGTLVPLGAAAAPKTAAQPQTEAQAPSAGGRESDPEAVELLRQLEAKYGNVSTVTGAFRQSNKEEGPMAKKTPLEMSAWFHMQKPNKFRVDYQYVKKSATQPPASAAGYEYDSTNLVVNNEAKQYIRDLDQVTIYKLGRGANVRDLNYLLLGFGAHTEEVLRVYRVTLASKSPRGYRTLVLTPRNQTDAGFKSISMSLTDDENLFPYQFTLEHSEASGTSSRITVTMDPSSLRMGGQLPRDIFVDKFPTKNRIPIGG